MKILLVTWVAPLPTSSGGSQRTNLLHRALAECGAVDLVVLAKPSRYTTAETLTMQREFGLKLCLPIVGPHDRLPWRLLPIPPQWKKRISQSLDGSRSWLRAQRHLQSAMEQALDPSSYDIIVGRFARSLAVLGLHDCAQVPIALDIDDWDVDRYQSRLDNGAAGLERLVLRRHVATLRHTLPGVIDAVNVLWVANGGNLSEPLLQRAKVLPNIPFRSNESGVFPPCPSSAQKIVTTIGSYAHRSNVVGVDWFLDHVWPEVLTAQPEAEFRIHGSSLRPLLRSRWNRHPNVRVIGAIEQVEDAYRHAFVSVCSVRSGAGTNIKVVESLGFGRPCVTTRTGARGFDDLVRVGAVVSASNATEMARSIIALLRKPSETQRRGELGREIVLRQYSFSTFAGIVRSGVDEAISSHRQYERLPVPRRGPRRTPS